MEATPVTPAGKPGDPMPPPPPPPMADMPPISRNKSPEPENDESDASSTTSDSSIDSEILGAVKMDQDKLIQALKLKIKRQAKDANEDEKFDSFKLANGFLEYIWNFEARMAHLERKLGVKNKPIVKDEEDEEQIPDFKFETRFFNVAEELDDDGDFIPEREPMTGTFRSDIDARHFLRVAWKWRQGVNAVGSAPTTSPERPDPSTIEIFSLRIESRPISEFFKELSGWSDITRGELIELAKPFRILISHHSQIRDNAAKIRAELTKQRKESEIYVNQRSEPENPVDADIMSATPTHSDIAMQATGGVAGELVQVRRTTETEGSGILSDSVDVEKRRVGVQEAVEHFEQLVDFMDTYLSREISMYEEIKQASRSTISFENLWMLFELQETIFCPSKTGLGFEIPNGKGLAALQTRGRTTPQAYQVLCTANGLPTSRGMKARKDQTNTPATLKESLTGYKMSERNEKGELDIREKFSSMAVYCFYIDWDGKTFGTVQDCFIFRPFDGEVEITSLEAYPIHFLRDKPRSHGINSLDDLVNRGRKFIDMKNVSHMNYEGLTVATTKEEISSPVIVDMTLAFMESPSLTPRFGHLASFFPSQMFTNVTEVVTNNCDHSSKKRICNRWSCMMDGYLIYQRNLLAQMASTIGWLMEDKYDTEALRKLESLEPLKKHYQDAGLIQLLPGTVHGYALRNRKWIQMDINLLQPVVRNVGWESLVLPHGHREIVQAMVDTHAAGTRLKIDGAQIQRKAEVDLVRGKGKGCIILIHGAPGVGKTSTAECVAAYTKRPLFPITCGDIGYQPEEVEKKLDSIFNLAHKWGCVLLLDEADVFLAKRNKDDVKRNGLVSVFLRILEYYSGILFLTTNRVGAIDDAFRSRLHLTLYYPRLDAKKSLKIWKMNIKRIQDLSDERAEQGRAAIIIDKKRVKNFASKNFSLLSWNGRQIRNAFQTALALAEFEAQKGNKKNNDTSSSEEKAVVTISTKHFQTIAVASREFDEYLQQTHGRSEENQAQYDRMRLEEFKDPGTRLTLNVDDTSSSDSDDSDSGSSSSESESDHDSASEAERKEQKKKKKKKAKKAEGKKKNKDKSSSKSKKKNEKKEAVEESASKTKKSGKGKEKADTHAESDSGSDSDEE